MPAYNVNIDNVQQALDIALTHEGSEESWMTLRTPELDSNLMGVELRPRLSLRNSISYFNHSTKVLAFIPPSLSSQGEHIDYKFSVLLLAPVFNNDIRRVCPLLIYLVIWAPKDYIADTSLWNHIAFMTRESKVQKQRPVGLDNPIDKGIVLDTTCFSISRDIRAFENLEHKSQKRRPVGLKEKMEEATSNEIGIHQVELGSAFPGPESPISLLQIKEGLG